MCAAAMDERLVAGAQIAMVGESCGRVAAVIGMSMQRLFATQDVEAMRWPLLEAYGCGIRVGWR